MSMSLKSKARAAKLAQQVESERAIWWPFITDAERSAFDTVRKTFAAIAAGQRDHLASE